MGKRRDFHPFEYFVLFKIVIWKIYKKISWVMPRKSAEKKYEEKKYRIRNIFEKERERERKKERGREGHRER